jgi:hypothetical protein
LTTHFAKRAAMHARHAAVYALFTLVTIVPGLGYVDRALGTSTVTSLFDAVGILPTSAPSRR